MTSWRQTAKTLLAEGGLRTAAALGQQQALLDAVWPSEAQMPVDDEIASFDSGEDTDGGEVLLPIIQGREGAGTSPYYQCVFAHAFRTRGHDVVLPLCDNDICGCFQRPTDARPYAYCTRCNHAGRQVLGDFGLEPLPLASLFGPDYDPPAVALGETESYRDVPVAELALASTRRVLSRRDVDLDDSSHATIYRGFLESAVRLVDAAEALFTDRDVAAVLAWDGSYVYGGVFLHVGAKHDVPTYQAGAPLSSRQLMIGRVDDESMSETDADEAVAREYLETPLSPHEGAVIDATMQSRAAGEDMLDPIAGASQSIEETSASRTVGLFTNLMWDASLEGVDIVFESPYEWIRATIEWARETPDTRLIIKTHPAEAVFDTSVLTTEWIEESLAPLPDNVEVLEPDTDVSPYELVRTLDVALVYTSTIGLEMAYYGVPVVVSGDTHYRNRGFTHDPETSDEYRATLESIETLSMTEEMQVLSKRYSYLLFEVRQLPFPELDPSDEESPPTHEDISGGNPSYDLVVDAMLSNEPVVRERRRRDASPDP